MSCYLVLFVVNSLFRGSATVCKRSIPWNKVSKREREADRETETETEGQRQRDRKMKLNKSTDEQVKKQTNKKFDMSIGSSRILILPLLWGDREERVGGEGG